MILNRQRNVRVAQRPLELFLRSMRRALGIGQADLTICFVTDAEIARMNETFRKKKGPTDVLSFPSGERRKAKRVPWHGPKVVQGRLAEQGRKRSSQHDAYLGDIAYQADTVYLGDIAISPAAARRNAKLLGRNLRNELQILMLHGVLHLLGFDHERDRGEMDRLERRLQQRLRLT